MTNFEQFLQDNSTRQFGGKPLFQPGSYDPNSAKPWQALAQGSPVTAIAINNAERKLQCTFPEGYKIFLQTLGPGSWAGLHFPHPTSLYAFDASCGEMEGYVILCFNVNGAGDYVAFNPKQQESNIYFCSHDPLGCARIGASFEELIKKLYELKLANPKDDMATFYSSLEFKPTKPKPSPKKKKQKKWWQFWK
ncbi:MAG TPA: SMI1/KNR4 family protein [Candidatus Obscuribacterales bacterium]